MKFHAHDRVIELLIGGNLYNSADAAIRELLQNAEDALELQGIADPASELRIDVRYSVAARYIEVQDTGYGMNEEALEKSFAAIGAPKTEVSHIRDLLAKAKSSQIALFGIGILSCFGIAAEIEVETKTTSDDAIRFSIQDYRKDFDFVQATKSDRGTRVRLLLKANSGIDLNSVPDIVQRYARHAAHVAVHNIDIGATENLTETWRPEVRALADNINDQAVLSGRIVLARGWKTINEPLLTSITLCNGGFLVEENNADLLPRSASGIVGELDIRPGSLTILMSREGYKRDDLWKQLSNRLLSHVKAFYKSQIEEWANNEDALNDDDPQRLTAVRGLLLILRGHPQSLVEPSDKARAQGMLKTLLRLPKLPLESPVSVSRIVEEASKKGFVYTTREGEQSRAVSQSIASEEGTVKLTENTQTLGLRILALTAKGFVVVRCMRHNYSLSYGGQQENFQVLDEDVLGQFCNEAGVKMARVEDAPDEHINIAESDSTRLVNTLFSLGADFKVTFIENSSQRVIRDYTGRFLNAAHPEVSEILRAMPDALGNPVRRRLLAAYMALAHWDLIDARSLIKDLLLDSQLAENAQLKTGRLLADHLRSKLTDVLSHAQT